MTVEVQDPFNTYNAAPGATVFPYEFKIVSSADLIATIDDIVIDLGIDFSLSGVGSNDGGDLTLFAPLVGGEVVLLKRQMTFNRLTDYQQNGDFNAPVVNNDFDRIWLAMQQLGQDLKRSIKVAFTETTDQTIPVSPAARANKALVFDASGNITASQDNYNDQAANAAASAAAALISKNAAESAAADTDADRLAADAARIAAEAAAASINPANLMHLTGAETATGKKTFAGGADVPDLAVGDNTANAANGKLVKATVDAYAKQIRGVTSSVASNALTVGTPAKIMEFRDPTLNVGASISLSIGALSIVVPSGATLGTRNGIPARLMILTAYNAGVPVLCLVNAIGGLNLDESQRISPTLISAGATAANIIYSASAVAANSSFRIDGYLDITEAAAGTWATDATVKQGAGGLASQARVVYTPSITPLAGAGVSMSATHNLGNIPFVATLEFVCLVAGAGYSVGDVVQVPGQWNGTTPAGALCIAKDVTTVYALLPGGQISYLLNKTTGAAGTPNSADWAYRFALVK